MNSPYRGGADGALNHYAWGAHYCLEKYVARALRLFPRSSVFMHLTQALHKALRERPNHVATIDADRRQNFTQFVGRVARLAGALQRLDFKRGDRVGMLSLSSDRFVEYLYGSFWAGAVVNPVNFQKHIIENSTYERAHLAGGLPIDTRSIETIKMFHHRIAKHL